MKGFDIDYGIIETRYDGGAGSGNWGHVGRPGEVGGSSSGGGLAFRAESTNKWMVSEIGKYCSQAKIRNNTLQKLKSKSSRVQAQGVKQAQMYNMEQKSFKNVTKFDPMASKNILADNKQNAISEKYGVKGTNALRKYEIQNHNLTAQQAAALTGGKANAQVLKSIQTKQNQSAQKANVQATKQAAPANQNKTTQQSAQKASATTPPTTPQKASKTSTSAKGTSTKSSASSTSNTSNTKSSSTQTAKGSSMPQASTQTQTGRPLNNANYQKALAAAGDTAKIKAFYNEAKNNGKFNKDPKGGKHSDTQSKDNGNIQKLVNYMGLTEPPTLVDSKTFAALAKGREDQVMFRGVSNPAGKDQFKSGKCNRMGGIAYGTGVYFGGSKDGTYKTSCAYGKDIKILPKPDAKILDVDSSGKDKSGKVWKNKDSNNNTQYTEAIISGYDAVRIKGAGSGVGKNHDYIVVWNRAAFICEK